MSAKEQAEAVINSLREKGFTDDEIATAVIGKLKELNSTDPRCKVCGYEVREVNELEICQTCAKAYDLGKE
jgi:predicted Zn-ribbon and HTH transcriptional regulator